MRKVADMGPKVGLAVRGALAFVLSACLVMAFVPATALAEGADPGSETGQETEVLDISRATVTGLDERYTYTGKAIEPKVGLELDGEALVAGEHYSVEFSGNTAVGTAKATFTALAPNQGTLVKEFTIAPQATSFTKTSAVGSSMVLQWKKRTDQVDGYQVRYATDKGMSGAKSITVKPAGKAKLTVKGLKRGKTYYLQIRTYKGAVYGDWATASLKMAALGRTDLTGTIDKANKSKSLTTFNTTYDLKKTKAGKNLIKYVNTLKKKYKVNIVMMDLTTGEGIACAPKRSMYSASCLKGPFVASLNKWKPSSRRASAGTMRQTIVVSNNDTYAALRSKYGSSTMKKMHKYAGIGTSGYARRYRYLPTKDLAKLWVATYWYFYKDTNGNSKWARSLYTHGLQSFIYRGMRGTSKVHAKPGWYPGGGFNVQNDAGVVMSTVGGKQRPYVIACMTSACNQHSKLRKLVRLVDKVHTDMCKQSGYSY